MVEAVKRLPEDLRPSGPEAIYHLFHETSEHLRATEQKHLQVSIGFFGAVALALSFLAPQAAGPTSWTLLHTWGHAIAYYVLVLIGCTTMFAQHIFRGWKRQYLLSSKKLVSQWPIPDPFKVEWMRTSMGMHVPPYRRLLRVSGENSLYYFTFAITTSILILLLLSITNLIHPDWIAWLMISTGGAAYLFLVGYISNEGMTRQETLEEDWNDFKLQFLKRPDVPADAHS